jgi:hypothetical protein
MEAMLDWLERYRGLPSSYDWSRTHANRRGGAALTRLDSGEWPSASVVSRAGGGWQEACDAATTEARKRSSRAMPSRLPVAS